MMGRKRIEYIDYLKGLTVLWVVWYHTVHPDFVEFSFRIPLFFFVSGIFFRPYPFAEFIKKKVNTLIVPFVFFYLVYYGYLVVQWSLSHSLESFDFSVLASVFGMYRGTESFVVNPPLWFICALLNLQFMMYFLVKIKLSRVWIGVISCLVSVVGLLYIYWTETPFMLGRSLPYFIYYSFGYIFGRRVLSIIEGDYGHNVSVQLGLSGLAVFLLCWFVKSAFVFDSYAVIAVSYAEIFSLILFMIYTLKYTHSLPFMRFLKFYGVNSYIVLGMHEIVLTVLLILYTRFLGDPGIVGGLVILVTTVVTLWPVILVLNRVCPRLIGKNELWR
ncbi:MAG: acyltransferase [Duncaniella sp.]|nr:acyltransferase [Duncaniella sp.]